MLHAGCQPHAFVIPKLAAKLSWRLLVDTAAASPGDVYVKANGPAPDGKPVLLNHHSLRCYVEE